MTNIYKGPEAGIEKEEAEKLHFHSKTGWKVFFFIMVALEIISLVFGAATSLGNIFGEIIVYGLVLLGLYGFAFNKKIFVRKFWFFMIFAPLLWDGYSMFYLFSELIEDKLEAYFAIAFITIFWLPFLIFLTIAFYKYSFRSPEIWKQ
ncbi:hypothetical protein [Zooshikella harenae]|uniref:DUF805 domain-containing protein n=1 Tax=Zooshikella harenae TaxID=2827238 RepID=A0ABS5ZJP4_9GAMM|nr:hypothetical protein [Zooshikella harenae]MBU2714160.1 hypothetical protein [Zooshikella harenae]